MPELSTRPGRVEGKIALVTGGAGGLGEAVVRRLSDEGATVVLTDVDERAGHALAAQIPCAEFLRHDVRIEEDWEEVVAAVVARHGGLDVLLNTAGLVRFATVEDCSLQDYRLVNSVMSEGTFLGCKHAVRAMGRRGGSIINVASVAALRGNANVVAYAAAKGAVRALTKSVVVHCQDQGYPIRTNLVLPGAHDTAMTRAAFSEIDDSMTRRAREYQGAPSEFADLILFLASDESKTINGAEIVIDSGRIVR